MLVSILVVALTAHVSCAVVTDREEHKEIAPLSLPNAYKADFIYTIPYTATYLPAGPLSYPVSLWVNHDTQMMRVDVYDGLDSELHRDGQVFYKTPVMDRYECLVYGGGQGERSPGDGATAAHLLSAMTQNDQQEEVKGGRRLQQGALPSFAKWTFDSDVEWENQPAEKWVYKHRVEDKVSTYWLYVSSDRTPLFMHMMGSEILVGAHFDEYTLNFTSFEPLADSDEEPFALPEECLEKEIPSGVRPMSLALASLDPQAVFGRTDYSEFTAKQDRQHSDTAEYQKRAHAFVHHTSEIKQHNTAANSGFLLAANRYADWFENEFSSLLGLKRTAEVQAEIQSVQQGKKDPSGRRLKFEVPADMDPLPDSIDWRGSGAVGSVKDQGVCGSCWTFSASQAMSSAHFMGTGSYISLSEQQLMDCSWEYGENSACNGGDPDLAVQYVIDSGGSYAEKDYPYKGVDDFCKVDTSNTATSPAVKVSKVSYIEEGDVEAVKAALVKYGPLSIGVDAEPVPFRFYSSGVLDTPLCSSKIEDIDHAILLVGYGTEDGVPYWIVKNEWSAYWGDHGYMKVAQDNDCGIASQAFFIKP